MTSEKTWISDNALRQMVALADAKFPNETGGMLIGYIAETGDAVVLDIVGPGPTAQHARYSFVPDSEYQQIELESRFHGSQGRRTYLGDWHTHPSSAPLPSYRDKRTLAKIAAEPASQTSTPLMVILGKVDSCWTIGAMKYLGASGFLIKRFKLLNMEVVFFDVKA